MGTASKLKSKLLLGPCLVSVADVVGLAALESAYALLSTMEVDGTVTPSSFPTVRPLNVAIDSNPWSNPDSKSGCSS